jgi:hypothetical protein
MRHHLDTVCDALQAPPDPDRSIAAALRHVESARQLLRGRISVVAPIEEGGHYRRRAMDVPVEIENFRMLVEPLLSECKIRMIPNVPAGGVLRVEMRPESFHRILHILTSTRSTGCTASRTPRSGSSPPRWTIPVRSFS